MAAGETVQQGILRVLETSQRPMKALDIAKGIPCTKKEINQLIYQMREVERINPGQNPPLWRILQSPQTSGGSSGVPGGYSPFTTSPVVPVPQSPSTQVQSAGVASTASSSSLYSKTTDERGAFHFTPVTPPISTSSLHVSSPSTTPVQESDGSLSREPLSECTTAGVSETGFADANLHPQSTNDITAVAACVSSTPTTEQGKRKSKLKVKLAALFTGNHMAPEVDHVTQEKAHVTQENEHVLQKENHEPPVVDHVTQEMDRHLADEFSTMNMD